MPESQEGGVAVVVVVDYNYREAVRSVEGGSNCALQRFYSQRSAEAQP